MNKQQISTILIAILIFTAGILFGGYTFGTQSGGWFASSGRGSNGGHVHQAESGGEHMMQGMMGSRGQFGMMGMMEDMWVSSEREFIERMIPHHQEAVDTAREVLDRGGATEEIRTLAENIIASQTAQIEDMKGWYQQWYGIAYEPTGEYEPMMRELAELSGTALDHAFLEDMIPHHMGAIMMARSVQPHIQHEEIDSISENIIAAQRSEIQQMRRLLSDM